MDKKMLLLGDEAVGQAAIDAGLGGAFGYPGTPSTEIFEYIEEKARAGGAFCASWSGNEKVAYEEALGMSYAGRRAIVTMKCVGLNVAADPFVCSGLIETNGGLVAAVADDPGMHSSQNEQDSRYYGEFAGIPCFEPSDQQECYDMTREAFELSERSHVPALLRLVTRIAHSRAPVKTSASSPRRDGINLPSAHCDWTLLPGNARKLFVRQLDKKRALARYSDDCKWNFIVPAKNNAAPEKGIICCGTGYNYARQALALLGVEADLLKIGFAPLPSGLIRKFLAGRDEVLLLEDGFPFVEERLLGIAGAGPKIRGRLDATLGPTGELDPERALLAICKVFGIKAPERKRLDLKLPPRPPMLCQGCPHIDTYKALNEALASRRPGRVFADIGCYTLGAFKPLEAIHSCVEMGASVGMAKGAAQGGLKYAVAVIGDSTFEHSGLTTLLGAAAENTPMTLIVLDNGITAMTGAQKSLANGSRLVSVIKGLGVPEERITLLNPLPKNHAENTALIGKALDYRGLSVIIAQRECIQILGKKK